MVLYQSGSADDILTGADLKIGLRTALEQLGSRKKVLLLPPDFTRYHSRAGDLTRYSYEYYQDKVTDVLPATGTHALMTREQILAMFPGVPLHLFRVHDWRSGFTTLGTVSGDYVHQVSDGVVNFPIPAQIAKLAASGAHDLILSIGQIVPHEVTGMANFNKNVFVGIGGAEGIHKCHFLGAAYGIERIMGRIENPVRKVLNYASNHFAKHLPIIYVLTVIGSDVNGKSLVRGLFIGDDVACFHQAAELSLKINFQKFDQPFDKIVVYLDPAEFKSTWVGNKSIYRTRMAIADRGELIVLAPGLTEFGEDRQMDHLIRKYGYVGTPRILAWVEKNTDLRENLAAAAHLIHGSTEGRFRVTYCPGKLSKEEIEAVGFNYGNLRMMSKRYDPNKLKDGMNIMPDGEPVFYISNPALGLWAHKDRLAKTPD